MLISSTGIGLENMTCFFHLTKTAEISNNLSKKSLNKTLVLLTKVSLNLVLLAVKTNGRTPRWNFNRFTGWGGKGWGYPGYAFGAPKGGGMVGEMVVGVQPSKQANIRCL